MTLASAALLLAASQIDRLDWAARMVGVDERTAALAGWRVFRFTWADVDSGAFADTMIKAMGGAGM